MKIRDVKTYVMASPGRDYVFVKVDDRRGALRLGRGHARAEAAHGRDRGRGPEGVPDRARTRPGSTTSGSGCTATGSGAAARSSCRPSPRIEQALWDITGKAYGQPVYKLLGGAVRDYIPCYTHTGDPAVAKELMKQGWHAFKSGPFFRGEALPEDEIIRRSAKQFEAMREAIGPDGAADVRLPRQVPPGDRRARSARRSSRTTCTSSRSRRRRTTRSSSGRCARPGCRWTSRPASGCSPSGASASCWRSSWSTSSSPTWCTAAASRRRSRSRRWPRSTTCASRRTTRTVRSARPRPCTRWP